VRFILLMIVENHDAAYEKDPYEYPYE
jgi:hypothetical protein